MTESTEERFWDKVLITESCWLWTGTTNSELGHRYGVTPEAIYAIRVGKNWRHVQ